MVVSWMGIQVGLARPMARQGTMEPPTTMDEAWMDLRARLLLARLRDAWMDGLALGSPATILSLVLAPTLPAILLLLLVVPLLEW